MCRLTDFCCLLQKLAYQLRQRLWSTSLVALGKNLALLLQFPADHATNRIKVVWGYLWKYFCLLADTGMFCTHPNQAIIFHHLFLRWTYSCTFCPSWRENAEWAEAGEWNKLPQRSQCCQTMSNNLTSVKQDYIYELILFLFSAYFTHTSWRTQNYLFQI